MESGDVQWGYVIRVQIHSGRLQAAWRNKLVQLENTGDANDRAEEDILVSPMVGWDIEPGLDNEDVDPE